MRTKTNRNLVKTQVVKGKYQHCIQITEKMSELSIYDVETKVYCEQKR